jgi:hypothetical protein
VSLKQETNLTFTLKPPSACSPAELKAFTSLVKAGDEANLTFLDDGITRAHLLAFCHAGTELAGVAALKDSGPGHQNDVFQRAGIPDLATIYTTEIGYVTTKPSYRGRGICTELTRRLLATTTAPVFASARCRNTTVITIFNRLGFTPIGHRFRGRHKRPEKIYFVQLFVRE